MLVADVMTPLALTIGPAHTLRDAARLMAGRRVGSAVVVDPETAGLGIITERDILVSLGLGEDPDRETADAHTTTEVVFAAPGWTLARAADAMLRGGFRHLVVVDGGEIAGVLSVRDVLRGWSAARTGGTGLGQSGELVGTG
ncbi:CBS domain-containing protein [Phaeacidiphilus oryzae]|uniref:CBS domain-containing protein n=1 Tax=Phaeacidiphilus oryzae TaxID=348818 RepID=UPI00068CF504|nr:CBS domain-containing protein [Phaeacidiphilus oryzae]